MNLPPGMRDRYARIARRCEQRFGKTPPPLPTDPFEASNLMRRLVAQLNDTRPVRIKRGDPLQVHEKAEEPERPAPPKETPSGR